MKEWLTITSQQSRHGQVPHQYAQFAGPQVPFPPPHRVASTATTSRIPLSKHRDLRLLLPRNTRDTKDYTSTSIAKLKELRDPDRKLARSYTLCRQCMSVGGENMKLDTTVLKILGSNGVEEFSVFGERIFDSVIPHAKW